MRTSEVLRQAKAALEKGWAKRALCNAAGEVCALGAIRVACGADRTLAGIQVGVRSETEKAARRLLGECSPTRDVIRFNNAPSTTLADVVSWFDAAVAIAEQQEQAEVAHPTLEVVSR